MESPADSDPTVKIVLDVTRYGVNVYAGQSMKPQETGRPTAVGIFTLEGTSKPPGIIFRISVFPDGSTMEKPFFREVEKIVDLSINHSQMPRIMEILKTADAAHALYRVDDGKPHADVHGEFSRTNRPPANNDNTNPNQ